MTKTRAQEPDDGLEQQQLFEFVPLSRDARLLLAMFYFRRILDLQAIALCVTEFSPLSRFFDASPQSLKRFFARHQHVRGYVSVPVLCDPSQREKAFRYSERTAHLMQTRWPGTLALRRSRRFPARLRAAQFPVNWLFSFPYIVPNDGPTIAIAGSRRSNPAQLSSAGTAAQGVAHIGARLITGLATGADIAAHEAFLRTADRDGPPHTVAVLGSGLAHVYPAHHRKHVSELLRKGGCVLGELPPDMNGNAETFVSRNRIIVGLADALVVISGEYASGTAHSVRFAKELDIPIFSVDPAERSGISRLVIELGGHRLELRDLPDALRWALTK